MQCTRTRCLPLEFYIFVRIRVKHAVSGRQTRARAPTRAALKKECAGQRSEASQEPSPAPSASQPNLSLTTAPTLPGPTTTASSTQLQLRSRKQIVLPRRINHRSRKPHDFHPAFRATASRPDSTSSNPPKQPWQLYAMAMISDNQISSSSNCRRSSSASSGRRSATNTTASAYVVNAATMDLTAYQYSTCGAGGMYTLCGSMLSSSVYTNEITGVGWCV